MFTVSLHGIKLHAKIGLYPEEKIHGNNFEIDIDVFVDINNSDAFPFIDYAIVHQIVLEEFSKEGELLETFVGNIHKAIKSKFVEANKVRVAIRKLNPPLQGLVNYSQVSFEA
ncbi:MAG TPA: dihydroneopterin aldolase [Flavipsychrobacter sp.]|nr:dihydroneopterin aldolase [Flavipsychrobacter sp.]